MFSKLLLQSCIVFFILPFWLAVIWKKCENLVRNCFIIIVDCDLILCTCHFWGHFGKNYSLSLHIQYSHVGQRKPKCMKFNVGHALCIEKQSFMFPSKAGGQCTFWKFLAYLCTLLKICIYVQNSLVFFTLKRSEKKRQLHWTILCIKLTQLQQHYSYANTCSPVAMLGIVYTMLLKKLKIL